MTEENEDKSHNFLSATQLLKVKGLGSAVWEEWQKSEFALPRIGKKYFEPTGTWLQTMQLENGLKNRKRLLDIQRVDRRSQLALAEWLPGIQRARITKRSGQKWDSFGYEEKCQLYLLPEEALVLLEMCTLELSWNGMPLSIQQAYEVLVNSENSKCTLDEYKVYSQLIRSGYKARRIIEKSSSDGKSSNATKRIIMNPDGLWTPNISPTVDKQSSDSNGSSATSKNSSEQEDDFVIITKTDRSDNNKPAKEQRIGIVSEETVLGNIKIIKNNISPVKDTSATTPQASKWLGSRIQRNVKLMPKRSDKVNNTASTNVELLGPQNNVPQKRRQSDSKELPTPKKPRPEVIELSDDEIEEIPRPMTRMEILNSFPNMAGNMDEPLIAEIPRGYIPHNIKPSKEFYRFDRQRLLNLSQSDSMLKSNMPLVPVNNIHNGQASHFYSQRNQSQAITAYGSHNGYSYRGMRCQRYGNSYIQHNILHNTIQAGNVFQSNYVNYVMEVMGNMVRSFRQQQFQQTTFCQNLQMFSPRFSYMQQRFQPYSMNHVQHYTPPPREPYYRRGGAPPSVYTTQRARQRNYFSGGDAQRVSLDEPNTPSFSNRPGVDSWSDLKKKWREESTITIEDEEPMQTDSTADISEVQVVEESINPIISTKGLTNLSQVYERLRIIKPAADKTVRSRKTDYGLSYEVYPPNVPLKKSNPGPPLCRLFIINSKKDACIDANKLQRMQQESKEVPLVVAFVSQSCISYLQPGAVLLPNLS